LKKDVADTNESTLKVPSLTPKAPTVNASAAPSAGSRVRATPAARRAARDKGINLEDVAAKFPGKVLSEEDVANFAG
jgi:pyruvate dehydrogenase E2 component (dihydrolipoamide acetyltransferase)